MQVDSTLLPLTGESVEHRTAIETNEARLDIIARGFWIWGHQAFLDVRIFDPNACRYSNSSLSQCYATNEKEQKRNYNAFCRLNKEPLAPWYFRLMVVWVENVKLSTKD